MNIYVDGCSYTYGYGLDRRFSLANLLSADSIDKSYAGKSNYSIALDLYESNLTSDLYVIGWTYSDRTEFNFNNKIIQTNASRTKIRLDDLENAEYFEKEYHELQSRFYRYSSRQNVLSDFFIDSVASILTEKNKKFIFFSWEQRNCKTQILYPEIVDDYRQQDIAGWETIGHLTEDGMRYLANIIMEKIDE